MHYCVLKTAGQPLDSSGCAQHCASAGPCTGCGASWLAAPAGQLATTLPAERADPTRPARVARLTYKSLLPGAILTILNHRASLCTQPSPSRAPTDPFVHATPHPTITMARSSFMLVLLVAACACMANARSLTCAKRPHLDQ